VRGAQQRGGAEAEHQDGNRQEGCREQDSKAGKHVVVSCLAAREGDRAKTERLRTLETGARCVDEGLESGLGERIPHAAKLPEKSSTGAGYAATLPGTCCPLAISRKSQPFQAVFSIYVLNVPLSCANCH
jgi:hypothetical protein